MTRLYESFARSLIPLVLCAAIVSAQGNPTGNSSDVTGPPVTSGDVAGGAFTPGAPSGGTNPTLVTAASQAAVVAATSVATSSLLSGTMTTVSGAPISPAAQTMLLAVISANSPTTGAAAQMQEALAGAGPAASTALPALLAGLSGLGSNPSQLPVAIGSYNEFVNSASGEFLSNPPQAFLAVQALLAQLSTAASSV